MDKVHNAVAWYQKKIGAYDKQFWEQSVEKKLRKGQPNVHHASKKIVRLKTEFIDVDLVRGSTFSKAKPQVPWIYITRKTTVRLVFLPLCFKWWVQQTSWKFYFLLLILYFMQVTSLCIYMQNVGIVTGIEDEVSLTEVVTPLVLMMVLGFIHTQTMLSHYSHKAMYRNRKINRNYTKSKKRNDAASTSGNGQNKDQSKSRESHSSTKMKPSRQRNINVTSTEDLDHEQAASSITARRSPSRDKMKSSSATIVLNKNKLPYRKDDVSVKSDHVLSGSGFCSNKVKDSLNHVCTVSGNKSVLETETGQSDDKQEVCELSDNRLSNRILSDGVDISDDDVCNGKFEMLSVDQANESALSHSVVPGNTAACDESVLSHSVVPGNTAACDESVLSHSVVPGNIAGCDESVLSHSVVPGNIAGCDESVLSHSVVPGNTAACDESVLSHSVVPGNTAACDESVLSHSVVPGITAGCVTSSGAVIPNGDLVTKKDISTTTSGETSSADKSVTPVDKSGVSRSRNTSVTPVGVTSVSSAGKSQGLQNNLIPEENSSWKNLESYKKRLLDEDNFADTEHASDDGPSDTEPESGSFNTSDANSPERRSCTPVLRTERDGDGENSVNNAEPQKVEKHVDLRHIELSVIEQERLVTSSGTVLRRRRRISASRSQDIGEVMRSRNLPNSLGLQNAFRGSEKQQSSSENETTPTSEKENRVSSEEWENRMHSDVTTSSSYSSSCGSEAEGSDSGEINSFGDHKSGWTASSFHVINLLQPPTQSNTGVGTMNPPDEVSCVIWEGNECKKVDLTAFDIGWAIIDKVDNVPESSDYVLIGIVFTVIMGCFPLIFRAYNVKELPVLWSLDGLYSVAQMIQLNSWRRNFLTINGVLQRMCLSLMFFFLLSVADRTFKQRLLYAKHFFYLTSSRRARKFNMPHFRLNKVRNIKIWLSLRSYLKRRGPQRSVDIIVSASFLVAVSLVTLMCLKMLKDTDTYLDYMCNWEIVIWCLALGTYLLRFMTLGLKINKKYRSLSVLITEQINLYLQMEQKPHKKEELMLANNVLKLAEELLKELESPFKISGFSANPFIYNVTKVVVLSAFSAVLTELLGFKLKLYKIKFKA